MSVADVELLEKSRITVDDDGKAFRMRGILIPFDAILHIELSPQTSQGHDRRRRLARDARRRRASSPTIACTIRC